uniref:Sulfate transporter subunit n=1 Tax=Nitrosospira lacus TaxID=1288494 RepID=A0A1W6STH6_9PROT
MKSHKSHIAVIVLISLVSLGAAYAALQTFSPVSAHDPARELYADLNEAFATHWKARSGVDISIGLARSKSGKPIRAVLDGLNIPTLALSYDVGKLREKNRFIAPAWNQTLPQNMPNFSVHASPYTSTIVFLVRKGNPKKLIDWNDLLRPDIEVVTPNPKISDNGRWNYLAAWEYAFRQPDGGEAAALEFVRKLFAHIRSPAPTDFIERGIGDVLLVWENEAHLLIRQASAEGAEKFEIVTPSMSIVAEPAVSVVSAVADGNGAREVTTAYIDYLYTPQAQEIAGKHYYRPRDAQAEAKYASQFPALELFTLEEVAGGWQQAQKTHFAKGGIFEHIQRN